MYMHAKIRNKKGTKYIWTCSVAATPFNVSVNVFWEKIDSKKWNIFSNNSCSHKVHTMHCDASTVLCACIISCTSKNNSGTLGSQVDLSVYLSDCLSRHLIARCLFHPLTNEPFQKSVRTIKNNKRQMLSQIMMVQDEPAVVTVKLGDVQKIFQIWKLELILCVTMLCRHIVGSNSLKPLEKIISIFY